MLSTPNRRVYLDWSTLQQAYNFARKDKPTPEEAMLLEFVKRAAGDGNLCLSLNHAYEVIYGSKAGNDDAILAKMTWLESLKPQWIQNCDVLQREEESNFLFSRCAHRYHLGSPGRDVGVVGLFRRAHPENVAKMLGYESPAHQLVKECLGNEEMKKKLAEIREWSVKWCQGLLHDRYFALKNVSRDEAKATIEGKTLAGLRRNVHRMANDIFTCGLFPEFGVLKNGLFVPPDATWVAQEISSRDQVRFEFPADHMIHCFFQGLAWDMFDRGQSPTSKGFVDAHESDMNDVWHLACGAYCDVFTCDRTTALRIKGARESIGRPEAIYLEKGNIREMVENLAKVYDRKID